MIAGGALILALLVFYWGRSESPQTEATSSQQGVSADAGQTPPSQSVAAVPEPPTPRSVGEDVSVGYWTYRCNGFKWTKMCANKYNDVKVADAQFLLIDLTVRNDDKTASIVVPPKLVDSSGREYKLTPNTYDALESFDAMKELNPGVSSRGYFVFDVPQGQYFVEVSGGFESDKSARIALFEKSTSVQSAPIIMVGTEPTAAGSGTTTTQSESGAH